MDLALIIPESNLLLQSFAQQKLNLNYCPQVEPKHIFELVPLTNSLKELHLKGTQVSDEDMTSFLDCMSSMNENKRCSLEVLDLSTIDENLMFIGLRI